MLSLIHILKKEVLFSLLSTPGDVDKLECQLRKSGLWTGTDTRMRIGIVKLAGTVSEGREFLNTYREALHELMELSLIHICIEQVIPAENVTAGDIAVSYTHLDVYKRQPGERQPGGNRFL